MRRKEMSAARGFICSNLSPEGKRLYPENRSRIQPRMIRFASSGMTSPFGFSSSLYRKVARVLVRFCLGAYSLVFINFRTQVKQLAKWISVAFVWPSGKQVKLAKTVFRTLDSISVDR